MIINKYILRNFFKSNLFICIYTQIYIYLLKEVDMAAAFIPVLSGLDNIVKWGIELTQFQDVLLMKRPKESATGSGLLAPFEIEVGHFF